MPLKRIPSALNFPVNGSASRINETFEKLILEHGSELFAVHADQNTEQLEEGWNANWDEHPTRATRALVGPEAWGTRWTQRYGVTVSALLLVTLSEVAEMLTVAVVVTLNVVIVNVADVCPPAVVTVAARWVDPGRNGKEHVAVLRLAFWRYYKIVATHPFDDNRPEGAGVRAIQLRRPPLAGHWGFFIVRRRFDRLYSAPDSPTTIETVGKASS